MRSIFVVVSMLFFMSACHPLAIFRPALPKPRALMVDEATKPLTIAIDAYGIPFIKASNLKNALYGLGYMHARDRLFQLDVMRHAALGRLSEIFGKRTLAMDRKHRLLSYKLDEQLQKLSDEENQLLLAYVRGVNRGAKEQDKTAEHFFLGMHFEEFSIRDVIAIARLQAWQLGTDLWAELYRLRIARGDTTLAMKAELAGAIDDHNSAILRGNYSPHETMSMQVPSYIKTLEQSKASLPLPLEQIPGASNAWVINGALMQEGHAALHSDPHLPHLVPSNFYKASIKTDALQASGATFPGLPAPLIAASPHVAWGVTASYANTQDSVMLAVDPKNPKIYFVEKVKHEFEAVPERFCLDKKGHCIDEEHYLSIFGPVIDHRYDPSIGKKDKLAVMWTGFLVDEHSDIALSFLKLARAKNVNEAVDAVQRITLPGVNMVLADTAGNIAYAYAGLIPKRDPVQNPYLPLDGAKSTSKWAGVLAREQKPQVINPAEGFIVTANQNIASLGSSALLDYGKQGLMPYRAIRIREHIEELKAKHEPIAFESLAPIQMDSTSVEARELAPSLGRLCLEQFRPVGGARLAFAELIAGFDGDYKVDSRAALPFEMLLHQIIKQKLASVVGAKAAALPWVSPINYTIANALYREIHEQRTSIFASEQGISWQEQVKAACEPAYRALIAKAGSAPWKWRWGRHHYLYRQSPIAQAPLIGSFWRDQKREVAGTFASPLAEGGTPVRMGANLRFRAKMSNPPELSMVLDNGNSGLPGHPNAFDQAEPWHEGKTLPLTTNWQEAQAKAKIVFDVEVE